MSKVLMGPATLVYPTPTLLVGADVAGRPNFMTAAWGGVANSEPPMISVAIRPGRYTHKGVSQNLTFSVNIPSVDLLKETDYCGIKSGSKVNKTEACQFKVFYGKLGNAPLIEQCPVNLECRVMYTLSLGSHSLFIGRIEETYVSETCLIDGKPDIDKIKPFLYVVEPTRQYRAFGQIMAGAFRVGLEVGDKG
ncbi:MAG: NADPH-flavin oxidoreductase [Dehalococcoidales bacterium]|jgi:flavin reductase (DIM6/NTAB) family NADH-FMN oxidoreductase RutF|nr:NADPH-flavin oxidoreductase [Dehalococcoidales bacterium]MDP6448943.1 flavin reductase family protein [Dehalococcoidales bacterium]MDP6576252.1 flavin reductase family protein [Dehalococcoidales bacterium]MDP6825125.1 flavin reductase family protein [Dehalococcoidales bacterium]